MTTKKTVKRKTATKGKAARVTAVANQKGGVGKTTTAHALLAGLTGMGYKTLAVDIDPQENLTFTLNPASTTPNMYDLLIAAAAVVALPKITATHKKAAADAQKAADALTMKAIQHTKQGDVIPSNILLSGADLEFHRIGAESLLSGILDPLRSIYDYIIIDTPPSLGILTINALAAATDIIIPLGADAYSVQGFEQLLSNISVLQNRCNPVLKVAGLLITRHNERTSLAQGVRKDIDKKAADFGTRTFKTLIRESVVIKEAQLEQKNLYTKKTNHAVADYLNFVSEYVKGVK